MLCALTPDRTLDLYHFFTATRTSVPYYFPVDFEAWRESMLSDVDDDRKPLFSELKTFLLLDSGAIRGFIQFGITRFVFTEDGDKDDSAGYGLIRNVYCLPGEGDGAVLMDEANAYFASMNLSKRHAFFHYFGMRCYARQGKLHESEFHMEALLRRYGYALEHENVYYRKTLTGDTPPPSDIVFECSDDGEAITFWKDREKIGDCRLRFVSDALCYLTWIGIERRFSHQGHGTACMHKLLDELKQKGIVRLDTDATDGNVNAQRFYRKTGFVDLGRMRSYRTP